MSLLLKALQNAAKNREAGAAGGEGTAPAPAPAASEGAGELRLEPIENKDTEAAAPSASAASTRRNVDSTASGPERAGATGRSQAQNVLRAGALRDLPRESSPGFGAWLARRPLVAFSTAAGLFAIGYGTYLYLQITNPGIFMARPSAPGPGPALTGSPPPPPPPAASVAPPLPGPVAAAPAEPPHTGVLPTAPHPRPGAFPPPPTSAGPPVTASMSAATAGRPASTTMPSVPPGTASAPPTLAPPAFSAPAPAAQPAFPAIAAPPPPAQTAPSSPARRTSGAARPVPARQAPATAAATPPFVAQSDLNNAYLALQKGQIDDAGRLYRQVLASDPRNIDAMLGLASVHGQQNQADAATQLYMRVLEVDPRNSHAQAGLLNIGGRADPAAAESRLKQLIARDPSAYLYFTLGNLYAEQNQWAAAQGAYFQAFNMAPDNPDYAFNLAVGLEHLSQTRLALDYYRRAVSIAQTRGSAQFTLAPVQARIRSLETALAERP